LARGPYSTGHKTLVSRPHLASRLRVAHTCHT